MLAASSSNANIACGMTPVEGAERPSPLVGEHNDRVLGKYCNLTPRDVKTLKRKGVLQEYRRAHHAAARIQDRYRVTDGPCGSTAANRWRMNGRYRRPHARESRVIDRFSTTACLVAMTWVLMASSALL